MTTYVDLARLAVGAQLPDATFHARNTSATSENKIHDDTVARRYGFGGGLVPGATSYAYLATWLCRVLGPQWAAFGESVVSLVRPVYEGEQVHAGGMVSAREGTATAGTIALSCWIDGADGTRRAPATAALAWGVERPAEPRPSFATGGRSPRRPDERLPISVATAPIGEPLPPVSLPASPEATTAYLDEIGCPDALFRTGDASGFGGALVHPGWYPSIANRVLAGNFALGPWIHTRSSIRHLGPAPVGGVYHGYGVLTEAYARRGHEYVTADVLITDGEDRPVARLLHSAIVVVARRD